MNLSVAAPTHRDIQSGNGSARVFRTDELPDLGGLRASRGNTVGLQKRQDVAHVIKNALFIEGTADAFPTNDELIERLKKSGLPVSEGEILEGSYSNRSLVVFVKQVKTDIVNELTEVLEALYTRLVENNPALESLINKVRAPIDSRGLFNGRPTSEFNRKAAEAKFVEGVKLKLSGGSEEGLLSDVLLTNCFAKEIARQLFQLDNVTPAIASYFEPFAKRFILLERWGLERNYFRNLLATPLTLQEARESFLSELEKRNTHAESEGNLSVKQIRESAPWLMHRLHQVSQNREPTRVAPLALRALGFEHAVDAYRADWSDIEVRKAFYQGLIDRPEVGGDPRAILLSDIHDHATGLARYYFSKTPMSNADLVRNVVVRLAEEFHHESVSPLLRDQLLSKRSLNSEMRLALRYCYPSRGISHYQEILNAPVITTARDVMNLLEAALNSDLRRGLSSAAIAARFGVGARGIENLRTVFQDSAPSQTCEIRLWERNHTGDSPRPYPRRDMFSHTELLGELLTLPVIRNLQGHIPGGRTSRAKLKFSSPDLKLVSDVTEQLGKRAPNNDTNTLRDNVDQLLQAATRLQTTSEELLIKAPRTKLYGARTITVGERHLSELHTLCFELLEELALRHYDGSEVGIA